MITTLALLAVLLLARSCVDTSRFWSNYRHVANALSLYHSVKRLGIPDSQIILMLADQMPCNARNCFPGQVFNSRTQKINLLSHLLLCSCCCASHLLAAVCGGSDTFMLLFLTADTERMSKSTIAGWKSLSPTSSLSLRVSRHEPGTPASKKLDTDENSNIFLYMSGHGGDGFLKFQDFEEISSQDLADSIQEMHVKKRYNEIFFMVDTCQAGSLSNALESPKVVTIGSSQTGENSYAHHSDSELGLSVIDRFTFSTLDYLQRMKVGSSIRNGTLRDLFNFYDPKMLFSTPAYRTDILGRPIDEVPITDFLGSILDVHLHFDEEAYPIEATPISSSDATVTGNVLDSSASVLDSPAQRSKESAPADGRKFGFSGKFLVVAAMAMIGAVFVSTNSI
uniref:GPI-anchor transamidase n=1 Tax=Hyaloperonospora arabidopsidis (strain Emoy2) TaxID=559515 RepID=M4B6V7_HYAAE